MKIFVGPHRRYFKWNNGHFRLVKQLTPDAKYDFGFGESGNKIFNGFDLCPCPVKQRNFVDTFNCWDLALLRGVPQELLPGHDDPEVPNQEQELVRLVSAPPRRPGAVHVVHGPVLVGTSDVRQLIGLALDEKLAEEKRTLNLKFGLLSQKY